jgi:hypothetical protein
MKPFFCIWCYHDRPHKYMVLECCWHAWTWFFVRVD